MSQTTLPPNGGGTPEREPIICDLYNPYDIRYSVDHKRGDMFLFDLVSDEIRQMRQSQRKDKANQLKSENFWRSQQCSQTK